jgi:spore maturation protein CgeB
MRFLIIDSYYPEFLDSLYNETPSLREKPYCDQWQFLMDQSFGVANYYSKNLQRLGHDAHEIIANCHPLQSHWAMENHLPIPYRLGLKRRRNFIYPWIYQDWVRHVLLSQIESYRPDVIYIQDPVMVGGLLLKKMRPLCQKLIAQIASPFPDTLDFSPYDLILSSVPSFCKSFQQRGFHSEYFKLGFEPEVLNCLNPVKEPKAVFIGGISAVHHKRIKFLEALARGAPFEWWGYGKESLDDDSPLRKAHRGSAWGVNMYQHIQNASISINHHYLPGDDANNMRLYETTGVGTLLLTDHKANLHEIFVTGEEVVAYNDASDCIEKIYYYLEHDKEREQIALAGQKRTLHENTYFQRMQELLNLVAAI